MFKVLFRIAILFFIFDVIFVQNLHAQNQSDIAVRKDSLSYAKEIFDLKTRLEIQGVTSSVLYKLACNYSLIGAVDSSLHYLNIAGGEGMIIIGALADPDLENTRNQEGWKDIKKHILDIWYEYYPDGNLKYALALMKMENEDQRLRYEDEETVKKYGQGSEEARVAGKEIYRSDSTHIVELDSLIELWGWPGQSLVGQDQLNSAITLLLHSPLRYQKKYLPEVEESVESGELPLLSLAYLTDKIRLAEGEKQVYGTQLTLNDSTEKYELYPVEDIINLDKRRIEVGLDSIHIYLEWMYGTYN